MFSFLPQIEVNYTRHASEGGSRGSGFLYVNVRGCGYPPWTSCPKFYARYAEPNNTLIAEEEAMKGEEQRIARDRGEIKPYVRILHLLRG